MSPDIGVRCSCCDMIDFLPTICHCGKTYCQQHISPESHLCVNSPGPISKNSSRSYEAFIPCAMSNCTRHSISSITSSITSVSETSGVTLSSSCNQCQRTFCIYHRHPASHQCPKPVQNSKTEEARLLLAKHFPPAASSKMPRNNKTIQQSKLVSLMRMRLRALPGDVRCNNSSVPSNQRLFIRIRGPLTTEESVYWFHKDTVTGKVLDSLTSKLGLCTSDSHPFHLFLLDEKTVPSLLRNDLLISQQVQNDSLLIIQTLT